VFKVVAGDDDDVRATLSDIESDIDRLDALVQTMRHTKCLEILVRVPASFALSCSVAGRPSFCLLLYACNAKNSPFVSDGIYRHILVLSFASPVCPHHPRLLNSCLTHPLSLSLTQFLALVRPSVARRIGDASTRRRAHHLLQKRQRPHVHVHHVGTFAYS
jgi:hypothetical protein